MASLGFAACLQELLSDRRARYLLNFLTTFFTFATSFILRSSFDYPS